MEQSKKDFSSIKSSFTLNDKELNISPNNNFDKKNDSKQNITLNDTKKSNHSKIIEDNKNIENENDISSDSEINAINKKGKLSIIKNLIKIIDFIFKAICKSKVEKQKRKNNKKIIKKKFNN